MARAAKQANLPSTIPSSSEAITLLNPNLQIYSEDLMAQINE